MGELKDRVPVLMESQPDEGLQGERIQIWSPESFGGIDFDLFDSDMNFITQ